MLTEGSSPLTEVPTNEPEVLMKLAHQDLNSYTTAIMKRGILITVLTLLLFQGTALAQEKTREDFIRAFVRERYITWPDWTKKKVPFTVAVVNDSLLYKQLEELFGKKTLFKKRRVSLIFCATFDQAQLVKCGLVYLNKKEGLSMAEAISVFSGQPVLVVGENFPFNQSMINFISDEENISFEYNKDLILAQQLIPSDELNMLSTKNEIRWNKMIADAEEKLEREREVSEQKNKVIKDVSTHLEKARHDVTLKEDELTRKGNELVVKENELTAQTAVIDSTGRLLSLKEREIMLGNWQSQLKSEQIGQQKRFLNILVVTIILGIITLFFMYMSYYISRKLNLKLIEVNKEIQHHEGEVILQKSIVEEKKKEITDSINYAMRIQQSLLPSINKFNTLFPESFIVFKPKDIASGDFYWFEEISPSQALFTVVDCTGHGVPGAFMSLIGISHLNKIVHENRITSPDHILREMDTAVRVSLHQHNHEDDANDGMEMAICVLDRESNTLHYSGSFNPMWIVTSGQRTNGFASYPVSKEAVNHESILIELPPDKKSIASPHKIDQSFTHHSIQLNKGDCLYIFSDGYADQFGGLEAKKFKKSRFKDLLLSIHKKNMREQRDSILDTFDQWKGSIEQVDDVCVMGIRV